MFIVLLAGSPKKESKSKTLLTHVQKWLSLQKVDSILLNVHNFAAEDLLYARFHSPQIRSLIELISKADGVVISTPIYKASFSGALKVLLDILPERAFENKIVLPLATAGSNTHLLALDYALKPVIASLKANEILQGVCANDQQIVLNQDTQELCIIDESIKKRLDEALTEFYTSLQKISLIKRAQLIERIQYAIPA